MPETSIALFHSPFRIVKRKIHTPPIRSSGKKRKSPFTTKNDVRRVSYYKAMLMALIAANHSGTKIATLGHHNYKYINSKRPPAISPAHTFGGF